LEIFLGKVFVKEYGRFLQTADACIPSIERSELPYLFVLSKFYEP